MDHFCRHVFSVLIQFYTTTSYHRNGATVRISTHADITCCYSKNNVVTLPIISVVHNVLYTLCIHSQEREEFLDVVDE